MPPPSSSSPSWWCSRTCWTGRASSSTTGGSWAGSTRSESSGPRSGGSWPAGRAPGPRTPCLRAPAGAPGGLVVVLSALNRRWRWSQPCDGSWGSGPTWPSPWCGSCYRTTPRSRAGQSPITISLGLLAVGVLLVDTDRIVLGALAICAAASCYEATWLPGWRRCWSGTGGAPAARPGRSGSVSAWRWRPWRSCPSTPPTRWTCRTGTGRTAPPRPLRVGPYARPHRGLGSGRGGGVGLRPRRRGLGQGGPVGRLGAVAGGGRPGRSGVSGWPPSPSSSPGTAWGSSIAPTSSVGAAMCWVGFARLLCAAGPSPWPPSVPPPSSSPRWRGTSPSSGELGAGRGAIPASCSGSSSGGTRVIRRLASHRPAGAVPQRRPQHPRVLRPRGEPGAARPRG